MDRAVAPRGGQYRGTSLIRKSAPPETLPWAYALGPRGVLGGWAFASERGTPVGESMDAPYIGGSGSSYGN